MRGAKSSSILSGKERMRFTSSLARWDTQSNGLAEQERSCQDMQEVTLLSERDKKF